MSRPLAVALVVACTWTSVVAFAPGPALSSRWRPAAGALRMNAEGKPVVVVAGATGRVRTRPGMLVAADVAAPV